MTPKNEQTPWPCEPGPVDGFQLIPLRRIPDDRGTVSHMLRATDPHFSQFGEIYFSSIHPGIVKGWHWHREMSLHYACIVGQIKLVVFDSRPNSPTRGHLQEAFIGEANYALAIVPPEVWNGFRCVGPTTAIVANCATHPHDPARSKRMDPRVNPIDYDWEARWH